LGAFFYLFGAFLALLKSFWEVLGSRTFFWETPQKAFVGVSPQRGGVFSHTPLGGEINPRGGKTPLLCISREFTREVFTTGSFKKYARGFRGHIYLFGEQANSGFSSPC